MTSNQTTRRAEQAFAYVKTIPMGDGTFVIGIFLADGQPIGVAASIETAQVLCRQNDLAPALVH